MCTKLPARSYDLYEVSVHEDNMLRYFSLGFMLPGAKECEEAVRWDEL